MIQVFRQACGECLRSGLRIPSQHECVQHPVVSARVCSTHYNARKSVSNTLSYPHGCVQHYFVSASVYPIHAGCVQHTCWTEEADARASVAAREYRNLPEVIYLKQVTLLEGSDFAGEIDFAREK